VVAEQHKNPPAREADIERVETLIGARLPDWLRIRLLVENGFEWDDSCGVTGETWRVLPVMDQTDRKRIANTAEDIAWHTTRVRALDGIASGGFGPLQPGKPVPPGAVVIAREWDETRRLILLPDPADPSTLGPDLYLQAGNQVPNALGVTLADFAPSPELFPVNDQDALPVFRYHPDPVATGSIRRSPNACPVCRQRRGWELTATPYGPRTLEHLCPWCVADGSAAAQGAEFVDAQPLVEAGLADAVVREVTERTPGFASYQQEEWQTCCGDACAFTGQLSDAELLTLPAEVLDEHPDLRDDLAEYNGDTFGGYAVFGFRCLHCGSIKILVDLD